MKTPSNRSAGRFASPAFAALGLLVLLVLFTLLALAPAGAL